MSKKFSALAGCLAVLFVTSGCYTTLTINCGNGTPEKIRVKSDYTGQEIEVPPNRFKKLPHSSGDIEVTTRSNGKFKFADVAPFHVEDKYLLKRKSVFGPGSVTLNVMLETNMQLYVVMPGRKAVDQSEDQPKGFPKVGQQLNP